MLVLISSHALVTGMLTASAGRCPLASTLCSTAVRPAPSLSPWSRSQCPKLQVRRARAGTRHGLATATRRSVCSLRPVLSLQSLSWRLRPGRRGRRRPGTRGHHVRPRLVRAVRSFVMPILAPLLVIAALPAAMGLGLSRRRSPRRTATAAGRGRRRGRGHGHRHHGDHDVRGRRCSSWSTSSARSRAILGHGRQPRCQRRLPHGGRQALSVATCRPSGPPRRISRSCSTFAGPARTGQQRHHQPFRRTPTTAHHHRRPVPARHGNDHTWNRARRHRPRPRPGPPNTPHLGQPDPRLVLADSAAATWR